MPRRRLGVVCEIEQPVGHMVDGLRRAVGDPALGRIVPHITLVPPVNVAERDVAAAVDRLAAAAAGCDGPLRLTIGPVASFLPANPVLLLGVGGELEALRRLRDAVFAPPLERTLSWPWVPHVTLADDVDPERIARLCDDLPAFAEVVDVEAVTLLEEVRQPTGRRWVPLTDASLGGVGVVGRGGHELTLVSGRVPLPEAAALLGRPPGERCTVVVTGRRRGAEPGASSAVVGAAAVWVDDDGAHVRVAVAEGERGAGVGGHLLAAAEAAARRSGITARVLHAEGPAGFYRARSAWSVPA